MGQSARGGENMSCENVEGISFRMRRDEAEALLCLMDVRRLRGMELIARQPSPQTVSSLTEAGYILPGPEKVYVDRVIALTLTQAARCRQMIHLASQLGECALYQGEKMCVLLRKANGDWLEFEPLRNPSQGAQACLRALRGACGIHARYWRENVVRERTGGLAELKALLAEFERNG